MLAMKLSNLFRKHDSSTPPTYFSPVNIIGKLINKDGGQVTIINAPYHTKPIAWRNGWLKRWRLFGINIYISNVRLKKRPIRDLLRNDFVKDHLKEKKQKLYTIQEGKCPHCGQVFEIEKMELHHILPLSRFPQFGQAIKNMILLCHHCHVELHRNPWANIKVMENKAKEFDLNLKDYYEI